MSKINNKSNVESKSTYPIITVQNSNDKKVEILNKANKENNKINNNNTHINTTNVEKEDKDNHISLKKKKHSISSKISNSFLYFKRKDSNRVKTTHTFFMTPLTHRKSKNDEKANLPNTTTYNGHSKHKDFLRVDSNISMNSTPGEQNYFSDASSAHSFISCSTTNSIFTAFSKKKAVKRLKRKDFSESIKELGSGATGKIHLVYRKDNPDKYYALKEFIIPQHKVSKDSERKFLKHLQTEYTIGTILHHRNVIEVEDFIYNNYYKRNRKERHVYQVMEYCNGGDLFDVIQSGKMTQGSILCYFRQLMEGLAYIHSMGVAHRDLKPENIMFKNNKILKILDFGAAIMFKTPYSNEIIRCSGIVGSEPYIAPEQFSLKSYDPRTVDIWSCGIIFLAMFYNELPWKSSILSNSKYKLWVEKGKSEIINDLPNGPRQLISRMLEPDPEKRITMEEIFMDKWFSHIYCCLDHENSENRILDYSRYNNSQISYTPSFINTCLRRNQSDVTHSFLATNNTTQTLASKGSSIKFSDELNSCGSEASFEKEHKKESSERTKVNDELLVSSNTKNSKKAIFTVDIDSDDKDSDSNETSNEEIKENCEIIIKKDEEIKKEVEKDDELKSFWGLDLKCSHEIISNVSFSK
ncbi:Pkinase-domain-containing protein [Piromyces finnis]|uniref:non-specific serine/threonine protein kinase n=1 Tax=Piromyces finnis TaxID=1754191 RepID=A0A1Y1UTP5_9FUNG|nr:Pkinase-domain-containing protein [Piromyces finnis]|eukprot:ORX41332.1 Pkinase-domain-containing protein [Piromyces finnis]